MNADWAEYWKLCELVEKTRGLRDQYERIGKREAAKTAQVRLNDLTHDKLKMELDLSVQLARAS